MAIAAATIAASPASANQSAASIQIATSVETENAHEAPIGSGDAEFRELFASWKDLDEGYGKVAPTRLKVAVPAGMPLLDSTMTSDYGMRTHPVLKRRARHKGVDLAAPRGTPVYATADGRVSMAQYYSTYGNYVQIEHGGELQTRYAHLSDYVVAEGAQVQKGDLIGYVGSTGRSTGPHLHYEVRVNEEAVNPIPYMTESTADAAFAMATAEGGQGGE